MGLNFIDVYQRNGHYPLQLPSGIGQEAAGVVTAVGPGVTAVKVGDRVAYAGAPLGAYAEARTYPADRLVPVPEGVSDEAAAASLLKGMTAWYLVRRTFKVERGQTVVVHAAAGGVGLHPLPVAEASRRDHHRHGGKRGQGAGRPRGRLHAPAWSSTRATGASSRRG